MKKILLLKSQPALEAEAWWPIARVLIKALTFGSKILLHIFFSLVGELLFDARLSSCNLALTKCTKSWRISAQPLGQKIFWLIWALSNSGRSNGTNPFRKFNWNIIKF